MLFDITLKLAPPRRRSCRRCIQASHHTKARHLVGVGACGQEDAREGGVAVVHRLEQRSVAVFVGEVHLRACADPHSARRDASQSLLWQDSRTSTSFAK